MIRLYDRNETNYNHNKTILSPTSCFVVEEQNGIYELEIELPKNVTVDNGSIIKATTQRGKQLFRVYRCIKSLTTKKYYARHIYYDLANNFLLDVRPTMVTCDTALKNILSDTELLHGFTGSSDIMDINTAYYIRQNPLQAIMSSDNSILKMYGGNLIRDNFNISIKAHGVDRGYEIRMGKNLIGIEDDSDESSVKTRLYPTVVLGETDQVFALPEKYVDSPLIDNYESPIIVEERIELTDEQKELPIEEIYTLMRNYCNELFSVYNVDKPIVNYKIDFVELSKTEQYKDLSILEQLDIFDIVTCNVSQLNINVKASVIKYKYDCLKERYESIEIGNFKSSANYQMNNIIKQINDKVAKSTANIQSAVDYATEVITGNKGGYLITRRHADGKPYELLVMDTEDINTAVNVLRINNSGIGFSKNGYNGLYGTAITLDGHIVADFMDTGTLTSILIKSVNYLKDVSGMQINLADGTIDSKNFKLSTDGTVNAVNGTFNGLINGGSIQIGTMVSGMYPYMVDSTGKLIASNAIIKGIIEATSGKIGPFTINGQGIQSNIIELREDENYPLLWLTKLGVDGGGLGTEGSQKANYEPALARVRDVEDGLETDVTIMARNDGEGNNGKVEILTYDTNGRSYKHRVELTKDGLSLNDFESGMPTTSIDVTQRSIVMRGKNDKGFLIFFDDTDGTTYISGGKININGTEF